MFHNERISPHAFCAELLESWNSTLAETQGAIEGREFLRTTIPVSDVPGLYIVGDSLKKYQEIDRTNGPTLEEILELDGIEKRFHPHELRSGARFAEFVHELYGHKLILAPTLYGGFVPGFDGIILDRSGRVIENFSVKTAEFANHPLNAATKAVEAAIQFSFVESWLVNFELMRLRPKLELTALDRFPKRKREAFIRRAERAFRLFGLSSSLHPGLAKKPRPTRIFIDMQDHAPTSIYDRTWRELRKKVIDSDGIISGIVVAHDNRIIVVERPSVSTFELTPLVTGSLAPGPESEDP